MCDTPALYIQDSAPRLFRLFHTVYLVPNNSDKLGRELRQVYILVLQWQHDMRTGERLRIGIAGILQIHLPDKIIVEHLRDKQQTLHVDILAVKNMVQ